MQDIHARISEIFTQSGMKPVAYKIRNINGSGYDPKTKTIYMSTRDMKRWPKSWPAIFAHELAHRRTHQLWSFIGFFGNFILWYSALFVIVFNWHLLLPYIICAAFTSRWLGWLEELHCDFHARRWTNPVMQREHFAKSSPCPLYKKLISTHPPHSLRYKLAN